MTFISETAAEVWRSIGLELIIFVVTLVFALIIRSSGGKKVVNKLGKGIETANTGRSISPAESRGGRAFTPGERDGFGERKQDRSSRLAQNNNPSQIIDEVVDIMRDIPSKKSADRVLALHASLINSAEEVRINEAARSSKHSAVEFYTTVVQCAIRLGKHHLLEGLLDDMSKQNVERPLALYESAMKQLAGQKRYHLALNMYDRLVSDGLEASTVTCSCLISFAAEVGELQRAIGFFEKLSLMSTPSIRAYMTVLRVHAKRQDWPASLAVFRDMQTRKVKLDSLVLNVILFTGVAADQIEGVEQLLEEAENFKPAITDVISYNTLIKGFAQRSDALKAVQVISKMRDRGLRLNAITYNTAMDAAVRSMRSQVAWDLLKDMRKSGFRPDKFTCSILVKGLVKNPTSECISTSLELLHEIHSTCDASLRSTLYHSVLEAAAQVPDTVVLMEAFTQMQQHQVVLTANAYRLLVQALGQEGDTTRCGQIWHQMLSENVRPQASVFISLLDAHLRHGQVDGALTSFESLRSSIKGHSSSNCRMNSNALLEECRIALIRSLCRISCESEATHLYIQARSDQALANIDNATGMMLARVQAESGNLSHAWMTIEDMIGLGHKPNEVALHSFLNACFKQSHSLYAKALLAHVSTTGITLSEATWALLLKLYGRCQQVQDAIAVFETMTDKHSIEPSSETIVCLLRDCFRCRQPGKALELMDNLQAKAKDVPLDGVIYRAAFDGCASAGLLPRGIALAEDAAKRGACVPADALEALEQAAQSRGQVGAPELERLKKLAQDFNSPSTFQKIGDTRPEF